jgi:sarcosine oxidase subunit delta
MRIACPHCGSRSHAEFAYHGDALPRRPDPARPDAERAFGDYVYLRDNPSGPHRELWYHAHGCHAWLVVLRDTATHEIASVTDARDPAESR